MIRTAVPEIARTIVNNNDYQTTRLPAVDPLAAVEALVEAGLTQDFWIYARDEETVVATDPLGQVTVSGQQVQLDWGGRREHVEEAQDPFAQVGRLLAQLPVRDWRAFGHVAFDVAGFYLPYPLRASTPLIRF